MQAVALFLSAASSLLLPASAPPNFARHAVAPARCALVACAADSDDARPLIGGLPAEEGEGPQFLSALDEIVKAEMGCIFEFSTIDGRDGVPEWAGLTIGRGLYVNMSASIKFFE